MRRPGTTQASQMEQLAHFLEEHPGFSPALQGADAVVCGFRVGECFLTPAEVEGLVAIQPHFDARQAALLLASLGSSARMG